MKKRQLENKVSSTIQELWAYVRENRDSLSAETHCRIAEEIVEGAVSAYRLQCVNDQETIKALRATIKDLKKQLNQSKGVSASTINGESKQ